MSPAALLLFALPALAAAVEVPGRGVPETLAQERAASIRSLRYELSFRIPESKTEAVRGTETVRFELNAAQPVVLDFEQKRDRILSIKVAQQPIDFDFINGHIVIPPSATRAGENAITIEFLAGDESLNRNDDYLYTLFVPARARYAFPCFDQPSLKARYSLTLDIPAAWQVTANGAETSRDTANGRSLVPIRRDQSPAHLSVRFRRRQIPGGDRRAQRPHLSHVSSRDRRRQSGAQPRRDLRPPRARPGLAGAVHRHSLPVGEIRFRAHPFVPVRRHGARRRHPL